MSAEVKFGDKRIVNFYTGVDIANATTVLVRAVKADDIDAVPFTLPHDIVDEATGHITHTTDGTLAIGLYYVEVQLEWGAGAARLTVPSDAEFETLEITPSVG